jgi:hypothetical protein
MSASSSSYGAGEGQLLPVVEKTPTRAAFELQHPPDDMEAVYAAVQALRTADDPKTFLTTDYYDVNDCPDTPPADYPVHWNAVKVLKNWNPDVTTIPDAIHNGLCLFDWRNERHREAAEAYRRAEAPFVLRNHPDVARTARRWSSGPDYLRSLLGGATRRHRTERSATNHFMFWRLQPQHRRNILTQWKAPTENVEMTFDEWHDKAAELDGMTDEEQVRADHYYFRLNAGLKEGVETWVYDELPWFVPDKPSLFVVEPDQERGINCRFGVKGAVAANHFDPTRNWIVVLGGRRRYVLAHPSQCRSMELYPMEHPSGRHSALDWSDVPDDYDGPFARATVNEVVLQSGDALYLPTSWFHYIVSLNKNYQCNARSGVTTENHHFLHECGFPV